MPTPIPAGMTLGVVSPQDAIRVFDQRKLLQPSFRWQDVWQEEHQRAFAVAGVMREDVLAIFRDELEAKLAQGGTLADFKKAIKPALAAKGFWGDVEVTDPATGETRMTRFDDSRLQLIYDVNVRNSYAAGNWQRFQATKAQFPLAMYRTMQDSHVRPAHRAWDGLVLPLDHPFWQSHWAPCGYRCRCHMIQMNQRGVDRLQAAGQRLQFEAPPENWRPYVNPYSGEIKAVPAGVDPGFGYNPGATNRDEAVAEQVLGKVVRSDALSGAVMAAQAATDMPTLLERRGAAFVRWAGQARGAAAGGGAFSLGAVPAQVVTAMVDLGQPLDTALIAVRAQDVVLPQVSGAAALFDQLPTMVAQPTAVLRLVSSDRSLIVVADGVDAAGKPERVFISIEASADLSVDGQQLRKALQLVRAVSTTRPEQLADSKAYQVIWGNWNG